MQDIFIIGVGMTPFGRMLDVDLKTMTRLATEAALSDAGIEKSDLNGAYFANVSQGHMERQHMIRGEIALRSMGIGGIPVINVENACASGSSSFNSAVNFVRAGQGDVALAVGAEKMYSRDRDLMFSVFDSGWDVSMRDETVARLAKMGEGVKVPDGTMSTKPYSVFMDVYAAFSRFHMKRFGTTRAQLAAVAAKNHDHSIHNPQSQYRERLYCRGGAGRAADRLSADFADVRADLGWRCSGDHLQQERLDASRARFEARHSRPGLRRAVGRRP